jgi:signal transduction histidine kinase
LGWIASDNFINHEPLHDYQLELMRLYGAILGQLYVQKQTQQMLAEKEKRLQFALNAANMRSWDWDMQTGDIVRYTMYDPDAAPISAATADFVEHIHADDRKEFFDAATRMIESSGIYECEFRFTEDDGALHWLYALGQPYRDENNQHIAGVAGVIQDITGRKSIEETLKRADQQAMELTLQKERVGALTEFISTISHDFKTPLAIINNSLYLLQRISDPVKQKDKLNLIKDQTLLLDKQIQDILTISRLDYAPQVKSHPVNINILASKIDDIFRASFENKKLTLKLELEQSLPTVSADADELDRALVNLVENAINYTPVGGTITITTRVSNKHVECEVCDTGIGMTSQDTQKVFNNFYRAENARMINSKGTGLGLAIVKKIVTNHNGTIDVESELGRVPVSACVSWQWFPFSNRHSSYECSNDAHSHEAVCFASLAILSLLFLLQASTAFTQSSTIRASRLGITFISSLDHPANDLRYQRALLLGAAWNRWPLYWDRLEVAPGAFDWTGYDRLVSQDVQHGLSINAILLDVRPFMRKVGAFKA